MKKLLFATDFSDDAQSAFEYTLMLAKKFEAELVILHTYATAYIDPATPVAMVDAMYLDLIDGYNKQLERLVTTSVEIGIKTIGELLLSEPALGVEECIEKHGIDYVIIGKSGFTGFLAKLVGSNVSNIVKKAKVPVFVIPPSNEMKLPKNILYGTQLEFDELRQLAQTFELADALDAETKLVHIIALSELDIYDNKKLIENIKKAFTDRKLAFEQLNAKSVSKGLSTAINLFQGDLLVVSTHNRSFFSQLVNPSKVNELAEVVNIPLLIHHFEDN